MMSQKTQVTFESCPNIQSIRDGRVFCWRLQNWVDFDRCNCGSEVRVQASQEW